MTLVRTHFLDPHQNLNDFVVLDNYIEESTTIELEPVECKRSDGSEFTYLKGEFDIVMAATSSEKEDN